MFVSRRGATLIEMLLVLGIIAIVLALLVPGIQKVRAAACRISCANNLRQIGVALHHYHEVHCSFPPGVTSQKPGGTLARMTWLSRILPYVEQEPLWEASLSAYSSEPSPYVDLPHVGFATPIRTYSCPADSRTSTAQHSHQSRYAALTSYVGVLGTACNRTEGTLFLDSNVRVTDISDGTSNTVIVGERPPSPDFWYGWWYAGYGQSGTGSADMLLGVRELNLGGGYVSSCPPGPYHFVPGSIKQQSDLFHFWSLHPGGAYFLFGDGSVRFLTYDADPILPALATRAGGEAVDAP